MLELEPLRVEKIRDYCRLGEQAYREHYLHLWTNSNPSPYLTASFTEAVLLREMENSNNLHFIVKLGMEEIGIVKLVKNYRSLNTLLPEPIFLEKIYLLNAQTGKGYGTEILSIVDALARRAGMRSIGLSAMKKGRALPFYKKLGYSVLREERVPFEEAIPEERDMYLLGKLL